MAQKRTPVLFFYRTVLSPMVLRRYALSIIALAILESGQWLKTKKDILVGVFFVLPFVTDEYTSPQDTTFE